MKCKYFISENFFLGHLVLVKLVQYESGMVRQAFFFFLEVGEGGIWKSTFKKVSLTQLMYILFVKLLKYNALLHLWS